MTNPKSEFSKAGDKLCKSCIHLRAPLLSFLNRGLLRCHGTAVDWENPIKGEKHRIYLRPKNGFGGIPLDMPPHPDHVIMNGACKYFEEKSKPPSKPQTGVVDRLRKYFPVMS